MAKKIHTFLYIEKALKKIKPTLKRKYKVKNLGIFGSFAKGRPKKSSDIDILVEFSETVDLLEFIALENFLEDQTGIKVDLVSKKALRPEFKAQVLNEVVYI